MMEKKNKETEFNQFWEQHHKQLILNAPKELRDEYVESTQLNSPLDWLFFILPLGIGILVQPYISKKESTAQVVERIKEYYYSMYLQKGSLEDFKAWLG